MSSSSLPLDGQAAVRRQQSLESMSLAEWRNVIAVILDAGYVTGQTLHVNRGRYLP